MLPASYLDRELGAIREEHESVQQGREGADARSQEKGNERSREHWAFVEATANKVENWPLWKQAAH